MNRSTRLRACGGILAALFMVCPAWGATVIYVDAGATGADDGTSWADAYPSVQPALDAAEAGDEVWVAAGTYVENVTLKDAVALYGGLAGTEDPATFDLAERDFAAHETILDGNQAGYVVSTPNGATVSTRIDGFTITNGRRGVSCYSSTPAIANNKIVNNTGRGIDMSVPSSSSSPVVIVNNTIVGNTGTGIYVSASSSSSSSMTIMHNTLTDNGDGGIAVLAGFWSAAVTTITVGDNIVTGNVRYGIGITVPYSASLVTITGNTITGNKDALDGGGIHASRGSSPSEAVLLIIGNTITGNSARSGGGIFCTLSLATITGNTITDNVASTSGGGVFSSRSAIIDNTIANNTTTGPIGVGGGICVSGQSSTATITGNMISGNTAGYGSGIYCYSTSPVITHNTITGNGIQGVDLRTLGGAGVHLELSSATITHNAITANSGGIYCTRGDPQITDCIISDNVAWQGGAIAILDGSPTITNCTFSNNMAKSGPGGGIYLDKGSPAIRNCTFIRNTAGTRDGGGISINMGTLTAVGCVFRGNKAFHGGGVHIRGGTANIASSAFAGNEAYRGGGTYTESGNLAVTNCTLSGNIASSSSSSAAGGVHGRLLGSTALTNSIVWSNIAFLSPEVYNVTSTYSNIRGGPSGEGNIELAPLFVRNPSPGPDGVWGTADDDYGDLRLQPDSPGIDAGNNAAVPADVTTDLAGQPRFMDDPRMPDGGSGTPPIVDMGAYEYREQTVATPRFDPDGGSYNLPPRVTITCTTAGASIHYTTDGSEPTESDPVIESGQSVLVSTDTPTTLQARAWKESLEPSGVKEAQYWRPVIIHVALNGSDAADGSSWATAKRTVQAGIDTAQAGDWVWVAAGTHTPTDDGDRTKSITMKADVALFGGFAGTEDPAAFTPADRDLTANETILSGDLLGNDNGQVAHNEPTRHDNSFHVVVGADNASLDGFTITGGNANGDPGAADSGGGMYNDRSSPTVANCAFKGNSAVSLGGGMYNRGNMATLVRCTFTGNVADIGGGMANDDSAVVEVRGCVFKNNAATDGFHGGAGMYNGANSDVTVTASTFTGNTGPVGGGMCNGENSRAYLTQCLFSGNHVSWSFTMGAGMLNRPDSNVTLFYCTFVGNVVAGEGGYGGAVTSWFGTTNIINSVFWGNIAAYGAQLYRVPTTAFTVTYSNVQGGWTGTGNIDADPRFASPWGNYRLLPGSPCIDAGSNTVGLPIGTTDLDGRPRIADGNGDGTARADMGAYEYAGSPTVVGLVSRKSHGAAGEFDLDLPLDGGLFAFGECRGGGMSELIITFSEPVFAADGVPDASEVSLSAGVVQDVDLAGDRITVQLSGVAETTCLALTLAGLVDAAGNPLPGQQASFRILAGDVDGDGTVGILDLMQVRNGLNQPVTDDTPQADVNADGQISVLDLVTVRNRLNASVVCP